MRSIINTIGGGVCALVLFLGSPAFAGALRDDVRAWRQANEKVVVAELADFVAIPNVADNVSDIERNAAAVEAMLQRRGLKTRRLSAGPGTPPSVFGELRTPGARRTIVFYAHMDGQPAPREGWFSDPFTPVMRDGPPRPGAPDIDWRNLSGPMNPEWRLYGRSTSDDKSPIVALMAALDAVRASGRKPSVNIKVFLEGEEEAGSAHLARIIHDNLELLKADAWLLLDGPVHQSRAMQVVFGARGVVGLEATIYGPTRALHDGHYGNWAPNPGVLAAHLVSELRAEDGRILIPGFYDDVRPLNDAEKAALAAMPPMEAELLASLGLARAETTDRLADAVSRPALNLRGIVVGGVGENANNAVPTQARISIDFRLVPDETPEMTRRKVEDFLRSRGWFVTESEPDQATRLAHPKIIRLQWSSGYAAVRSDMTLPVSRAVIASVGRWQGSAPIVLPMIGGSLPMAYFTETGVPLIIVPMVNHDNSQHAVNENLRLKNLWDGIEVYAGLIADLNW